MSRMRWVCGSSVSNSISCSRAVSKPPIGLPAALNFSVRPVSTPSADDRPAFCARSEEHTSELQSLMRISYAVFCLKKKNHTHTMKLKDHTLNSLIKKHNYTPK